MAWNLVSTTTERSTADLYEACARADGSAIDEFIRRYQPELAGYARRHGAEDPEGMADLATFDTVRRLAGMRSMEEPAVRAYLYRALKGRLIDERRVSVPQVSIDGLGVELTTDGPESPVLDQLEFSEMLELLTPAEREVVSHRFVGGYTSVETAARVGRSPDAVRRLQSNAIARLRLALAVAAFLVAVGAGYWLVSSNPAVRTTEPIDGPTEQQLPDSPRTSGRSPTTPGPEITPTPTGGIVSPDRTKAPSPSTRSPAAEPSTTISAPDASEQERANSALSEGGRPTPGPPSTPGVTATPTTSTGSTLVATTPPATSPATSTGPSTSATPTSTSPSSTTPTSTTPTSTTPTTIPSTTGPSTTSGDTVETTTTRPSDNRGRGDRGRGSRGRGNRGPGGDRNDDDGPGRGGGPGRGRGRGPHGPS